MRRVAYLGAAVACAFALSAAPATAHNAGCVRTGNGTWVSVGSGKFGPMVSENNPHYHTTPGPNFGRLDLQPGPGDQYGARHAADQGNSAVVPPPPTGCP